jgi:hypothetical protein
MWRTLMLAVLEDPATVKSAAVVAYQVGKSNP